MKSKLLFLLIFAFSMQVAIAQDTDKPKSTDEVLSSAKKMAVEENKNVFIMWHASWCGWCKTMDKLMQDESIKGYFDDSYVIEHLVVRERGEKEHLNNPGSAEMMKKFNGDKAGIPFWVILDKKGELLADSFMRAAGVGMDQAGKNTGCPQNPDEVDHWIKVLKTTTDISDEGLDKIKGKFLKK